MKFVSILLLAASGLFAQPGRNQGPTLPATCITGQIWLKTGAENPGSYYCNGSRVWIQYTTGLPGSGGGGSIAGPPGPPGPPGTNGLNGAPGSDANVTVDFGLIAVGTAPKVLSMNSSVVLTWAPAVCPPTGVGALGTVIHCTNNSDTYRGTGSGWIQTNGSPNVTPGAAGNVYVTNGSTVTDWGVFNAGPGLTKAFAGSTTTYSIDTAVVPTKAADNTWTGKSITTPITATIAAGTTLTPTAQTVEFTTSGDVTWTATPSITSGSPGDRLTLMNVGSYVLVLQDKGVLTGTNLLLAGRVNFTLLAGNAIDLIYSATAGGWMQRGGGIMATTTGHTWGTITGTWGTVTGTWAEWPL